MAKPKNNPTCGHNHCGHLVWVASPIATRLVCYRIPLNQEGYYLDKYMDVMRAQFETVVPFIFSMFIKGRKPTSGIWRGRGGGWTNVAEDMLVAFSLAQKVRIQVPMYMLILY